MASSIDKKTIGTMIKIMAKTRNPSRTRPRKRTLNSAEERGSLALTTETTRGETRETAFIDRKKAKAVPNTAIIKQIITLLASNWKVT